MGYWRNVMKRARTESLQLVRLDSLARAAIWIAVPVGTFVVTWWVLGESAVGFVKVLAGLGVTAAIAIVFFAIKSFTLPPVIHSEQESRIETLIKQHAEEVSILKKHYADLQAKFEPKIEIVALVTENDLGVPYWYLQVHNTSPVKSLQGCVVHIVSTTIISEGGTQLSTNLTLGTQNQWREGRQQGLFNLHPDETKNVRLMAPITQPDKSFRVHWAQNQSGKLKTGKYRMKIQARATDCPAVFASVLVNDNTVQLETTDLAFCALPQRRHRREQGRQHGHLLDLINLFLANARPEWDFKYVSKS